MGRQLGRRLWLAALESQQTGDSLRFPGVMSRSFYILAGTLVFFALVSAGLGLAPSSLQPGLPANASLWRTVAMFLLLFGLASALVGVLTQLFEQVDRRGEEARKAARRRRL